MDNSTSDLGFDPTAANLTDLDPRTIICYLQYADNEYDGPIGLRVSAIFVILVTSCFTTLFPVLATRVPKLRIPLYVYLFARYFGAGVIVATAFVHLLDPAYQAIGPQTCVGMTGHWADYSWVPAIAMASGLIVFFMDFAAERYVEKKYGLGHSHGTEVATQTGSVDAAAVRYTTGHQYMHSGEADGTLNRATHADKSESVEAGELSSLDLEKERLADISFQQQIAAFLILEFGVLFHSVIIGLALASAAWDEFIVLYPVIVFHQAFEGMGIGARLSAIQFPRALGRWAPWLLCLAYGFSTPIAIAIGLGVRETYNESSYNTSIVTGLLNSISAGILIYAGFVELLARDFLFNPDRTRDDKQLTFMAICVLLGAGIMALLGKWA
ncbi:hypothetical protein AMS68_006961 [Peltaster fructicola]|uniref:Uncharacterized protein n=1 Tax=Peltaster fructicola TaxID=286661 RepID=A0A6H0Y361_9PEZI|nr:hypothetical protein AMS68_006961 [Peltaster fructicola]